MMSSFSNRLEAIPKSGIRAFFDLVMSTKGIISLGVGEPDFNTPWTIREEAIYAIEKGFTTYTSNAGLLELRQEIARYYKKQFGCTYHPETEVLVTNGVSEGVDLVCRALLNDGDEVIVPKPLYVCYDPLIQLAGGRVRSLNTVETQFVPDPKKIEALITPKTKALVLCYPNNPTGMSIPKKTLSAIAKLVKKHQLWVISDEIYGELSYGVPFTSFASLPGMKAHTITLNGFSKSYAMTGWRIGYIAAPESVVSRACKIHQYSALCVATFSQYAAIEALKNGAPDLKKMKSSYEQRRLFFTEAMTKMGLHTALSDGAFYCFSDIRSTGLSSIEFATQLLKQEKVAVVPGDAFGEEGQGYIRSCVATKASDLKIALTRISRFVKGL